MNDKIFRLLVESPNYNIKYLVEEKNRNEPGNMYITGPFLMANEANRNNRIYPIEEMTREVDRYTREMIKENRAMGELNHPTSPEVNLERACHIITEIRQSGNIFEGKSKILSTPMGKIVRSLIMDGVKVGVSSRALGRIEESGSSNIVKDLRLVAVDVVADPSVPTAFVNGILESKRWVLEDDGRYEPLYNNFENTISKIPKKAKKEFLKEQMIAFINALAKH